MKRGPAARTHAGFTLIELMVVVAIVGILMVVAVVTIRRQPTSRDVGVQIATLLREASRKAVAGGALDPVAVQTLGGMSARTRLHIFTDSGFEVAVLDRLLDVPPSAPTWVEIERRYISPTGVDVAGYRSSAQLEGTSAPTDSLGPADELEVLCYPDGTCNAVTIYLERKNGTERTRVVLMPLNANPQVFGAW